MKKRFFSLFLSLLILFTGVSFNISTIKADEDEANEETESNEDDIDLGDISNNKGYINPNEDELQFEEDNAKIITDSSQLNDYNTPYSNSVTLPFSVDLSQSKFFPDIDNQGDIGACVSFSIVYYQMTYELNKLNNIAKDNENYYICSPTFNYNLVQDGYNLGTTPLAVYNCLMNVGAASIDEVPIERDSNNLTNFLNYNADDEIMLEASKHTISGFSEIKYNKNKFDTVFSNNSDTDLNVIRQAINNNHVLSFSTDIDGWNYEQIESNPIMPENNDHLGEYIATYINKPDIERIHEMTIVGYDDNLWVDINGDGEIEDGEMGAFKICNSWGRDFCNDGYVWLSYDALNKISSVNNNYLKTSNNKREPAILDDTLYMMKLKSKTNNDLYAKFTLESMDRSDIIVSIINNEHKIYYTVNPFDLNNTFTKRPSISFDGTNNLSLGTFVVDLSNLSAKLSEDDIRNSTWILNVYDNSNNGAVTRIKSFKIIDGNNQIIKEAVIPSFLEKDSGSNRVKICINKDLINNFCSIYYKGTDAVYLEYQLNNGSWIQYSDLDDNYNNSGSIKRFVVPLEDNDVVLVRFRNGYDNTLSKIYELNPKEYIIEDGKVKDKEEIFDISYFNTATIRFDNPFLDGNYLTAATTLNSRDVKYRFLYIDNKTNKSHTIKGYSTCNYVKINFSGYCDYTLVVQAKYGDKLVQSSFSFLKDYDNDAYINIYSTMGNTIKQGDKTRIIASALLDDKPEVYVDGVLKIYKFLYDSYRSEVGFDFIGDTIGKHKIQLIANNGGTSRDLKESITINVVPKDYYSDKLKVDVSFNHGDTMYLGESLIVRFKSDNAYTGLMGKVSKIDAHGGTGNFTNSVFSNEFFMNPDSVGDYTITFKFNDYTRVVTVTKNIKVKELKDINNLNVKDNFNGTYDLSTDFTVENENINYIYSYENLNTSDKGVISD